MPTLMEPSVERENARCASMMSLPGFAYAVASGKTKSGAPLPVRFWTLKSRVARPSGTVVPRAGVRDVTRIVLIALGNSDLLFLLIVPIRLPFAASSAPPARPGAAQSMPVAVIVAVVPSDEIVDDTLSECANGLS